jgi:NTP pyrophosphatase (non-canonical NTP hydrolase)
MNLRDFELYVVRCAENGKLTENEHIMAGSRGLAESAEVLLDYLDANTDYFFSENSHSYDKQALIESLGDVLFNFVYLCEILGIRIDRVMESAARRRE